MTTKLPNPKHTYKAQLLDYDALLDASDSECCYSLSEREVNMLLAFVDYIAWKTRYIATETEIDPVLIERWAGNLARKLMSGCCPDDEQTHRFSESGVYQSSDDGGVTWHDDPEHDPRNDYIGAPPLPGESSTAKRCAAADNVMGLFEQYRDNLISIVGATPTVLAIIAGILAFIGTIAGLSGVGIGIGVLFFTMAAEIISIGGTGISGEITFTVLQTFRCLVYCRMNDDGELTYDAWQGLLEDIAAEFDDFAELFFYQTVNGMGYIGVTNAGTFGSSTADDCGDCDCNEWCHSFEFDEGALGWSSWAQCTTTSSLVAAGWQGQCNTCGYFDTSIEITFSGRVTHIEFYSYLDATSASPDVAIIRNGDVILSESAATGESLHDVDGSWSGSNHIQIFANCQCETFTQIRRVTFRGIGINPFEVDNCE